MHADQLHLQPFFGEFSVIHFTEKVVLEFTGDTPRVTGSNISVQISVSPLRRLRCQLITRGAPGMPIHTADEEC